MKKKKIIIKCKGEKHFELEKFRPFQLNLKKSTDIDKLKKLIIKYGFLAPILIWRGKIIDGHTRLKALKELKEEGYKIPRIPIVEIEAPDEKTASQYVLSLSSIFGKITLDRLYNYITAFDIKEDLDIFNLPDIDLDKFHEKYFTDIDKSIILNDKIKKSTVKVICPKCGFKFEV